MRCGVCVLMLAAVVWPRWCKAQPATQPATMPFVFAFQTQWDEDTASLGKLPPPAPSTRPLSGTVTSFTRHLGRQVPRSALTIYHQAATSRTIDPDAYARGIADHGFNLVLIPVDSGDWDAISPDRHRLAASLAASGVSLGLVLRDGPLPALARDVQWALQRMRHHGHTEAVVIDLSAADLASPTTLPSHLGGSLGAAAFLKHIAQRQELLGRYAAVVHAAAEIDPSIGVTAIWPGSSASTASAKPLFDSLPMQQAVGHPMQLMGWIDRFHSTDPAKPTWAAVDLDPASSDARASERALALVLTRGLRAIGTQGFSLPTAAQPGNDPGLRQTLAMISHHGGIYAMTEPLASIGILHVAEQAVLRPVIQDPNATAAQLLRGSHDQKATEAMQLCHAAGWPARLITGEDLKRGVSPAIKAILLVGLNEFDNSWVWYRGLEPQLQAFVKSGGRILLDDESICPVSSTATGMKIQAHVPGRGAHELPSLLARNAENVIRLRGTMNGVAAPLAASTQSAVWAIPTLAGDTQYVTAIDMGAAPAASATQPSTVPSAVVKWATTRPIYDLRVARKITPQEAAAPDFSHSAVRQYALPPAEIVAPKLRVARRADGFLAVDVLIANPQPMRGIPVAVTVRRGAEVATIYTATGLQATLPLSERDAPDEYTIVATELLSNQSMSAKVRIENPAPDTRPDGDDRLLLATFAARKGIPLTIALTRQQASEPAFVALADRLVRRAAQVGRKTTVAHAEPGGIVVGLRATPSSESRPRWRTIESDLVLLGTHTTNVLILDQVRGGLLPADGTGIRLTHSPFRPGFHVLNLLCDDPRELAALVARLEQPN